MSGSLTRGIFQMVAGMNGVITYFALKIPVWQAIQLWQFTPDELVKLEGPGNHFFDKYAPLLENYGVEIEFAGALLPILTAKVFAVIAAKQVLEANKSPQPAAGNARKSAPVSEIRPAASSDERAAAATAPQPTNQTTDARAASAARDGDLPDAFTHADVDRAAELVSL
jgi:hypothetical protein